MIPNNIYEELIPDDVKEKIKKGELLEVVKAVQLPLWPELTRIIPNHIARSSLFAPIKKGPRKIHDRELIASRDDVVICYTGKQLDMADQDVFLQALELYRYTELAQRETTVNRADFLRSISKDKIGDSQYKWLDEAMHRLKTGTVTITAKKYKVELSLIDEWERDGEIDQMQLSINPKIKTLFTNNEFGYINWPHRMAIENRKDLSKWLQSYFSAHQKGPQRHTYKTIKKLSGLKTRINDLIKDINEALNELVRVQEISGLKMDKVGFDFIKK